MGQSVTFVAMVYQKAPEKQKKPFSALIEFHGFETTGKILEETITDWHVYHEDDGTWTKDERNHRHDKAMTCRAIFHAGFCELDGFDTLENTGLTLNRICARKCSTEAKVAMFVESRVHGEQVLPRREVRRLRRI